METRGDDAKEKKMKALPNLTPFAATTQLYTFRPSLSVNLSWSRYSSVPAPAGIDDRKRTPYPISPHVSYITSGLIFLFHHVFLYTHYITYL